MSFIVKSCWILFDQNMNQIDPVEYHSLDAATEGLAIFVANNTDLSIVPTIVYIEVPLIGYN